MMLRIQLKRMLMMAILLGTIQMLPIASTDAQSNDMWRRRDRRMTNFTSDNKAKRPGDLLFITIQEQSDVENSDQRTLRKQNSSTAGSKGNYGLGGGLGSAAGNLSIDQETAANRQFNGNTQFKSEREFKDRFTVRVVDTLSNGNLLISGTRNVSLEGDNRRLILTGIVRGTDVTASNTVSSRMISDLTIRYESKGKNGTERRFINQGWLAKKMNKLWAF